MEKVEISGSVLLTVQGALLDQLKLFCGYRRQDVEAALVFDEAPSDFWDQRISDAVEACRAVGVHEFLIESLLSKSGAK